MRRVYFLIFFISSSSLMLEVSLTRLFSIYLWYHFAFMVVSIAMLGIGSAGTLLFVYPKLKNISNMAIYAVLAGVSIILSYITSNYIQFDPVTLSWDRMQILYVLLYCFVLSIPFFFSGLLIATAFSVQSEKSGLIYGCDLIGAGTGSLLVLVILNVGGPEYAVLIASTFCFIGAFVTGSKSIKSLSTIFIMTNLLISILHPDFINVRISPYKGLPLALKYPGAEHLRTYYSSLSRIDLFKSPSVRFAPGLSLKYLSPLPEQIGFSIDGGEINAITKADNKEALKFLEFLPSAIAYEISKSPLPPFGKGGQVGISKRDQEGINILVLEPKGGLQVLIAEYYGAKQIHKVESNPLVVKIIKDDFREFSGKIFEHDTWRGLGRSYLHSLRFTPASSRRFGTGQAVDGSRFYDIIELSMTWASVTGAFGIAEDYRFTVEAFREYLTSLKKNGQLCINLYLLPPPRTELRILTTIITALTEIGVEDASNHIAAIRSWDTLSILIKKSPFNAEEIRRIKDFTKERRFDLVYYPGINEKESNVYVKMPQNEYFKAFKNILNTQTRQAFIENYLFDIAPVYDENPFFYYYLKLKNIKAIYELMGQKWQYFMEEGYILPVIFIQVFILSVILILLPVIAKIKEKNKLRLNLNLLLYFAMIGLGFMFVEVTLIQKSILVLENPAYAVAIVLTSMLISSGIGSLLSSKFSKPYLLIIISCLILIYSVILPLILDFISIYSLEFKIPMLFIVLIPLGFFMGMPFPAGIKIIGQKDEMFIPWAWAINGCMSVLAPILTIMIAMVMGFKTVLWLGALSYLLAFISFKKLVR